MNNVLVLYDNVLLQEMKQEQQTILFVSPKIEESGFLKCRVVDVGDGKTVNGKIIPINVNVGEMVMVSKTSGSRVVIDGTEYRIVKNEEIFGVLDE